MLRSLDIALPRMEREHRRYSRHKVDLPVELLFFSGETVTGKIMNVSEGGLALTHFGLAAVEGVVTVQFGLPSAEPQTFQAKAAIIWNDTSAMGLRFLRIEPACRPYFEAWLDSLEAQLQFRESVQDYQPFRHCTELIGRPASPPSRQASKQRRHSYEAIFSPGDQPHNDDDCYFFLAAPSPTTANVPAFPGTLANARYVYVLRTTAISSTQIFFPKTGTR